MNDELSEARKRAEELLKDTNLFKLSQQKNGSVLALQDLGPTNRVFFEHFWDVQSNFMSLQFGYMGRPEWLPMDLDCDLRVVGHTIEQEFLFSRVGSDEVFELAIDDLSETIEP